MNSPLWQLSACELQRRYQDGSLTPLAVAQACLARLDTVNPRLNAVVARRDERFLEEAEAATRRHARARPLSVLDGIPLTVKDSLLTADQPTTWGTPALRYHQTGHDELAVGRARAGGALIVGKTNVPEFALEGYTDNPLFGATGNPWAPDLTPGGSSGGAVAAVAAGIAPLAIGQDGGGSIRRPASHAGVVGLKPSLSAWPREHVLPSLLLDFEVIGPLARTVADARLLFDAVRGPAPVDRSSLAAAQAAAQPLRDGALRVLYVERMGAAPLDPQIAASVDRAVARLAALGHHVDAGALPLDLDFFVEAWPQIGQIGLASMFAQNPDWEAQASSKYREMAETGRRLPASRLWQIVERVKQLRRDSAALFEHLDVIVMPSAAALPWPAKEAFPRRIDGQDVGPRGHAVYTGWVNAAGLPALALPTAPSAEGLPIGFQLIGGFGRDQALLELGAAYEAVAPWADRWPTL
ncbi:amidase [Polaromonas sp.]|jgi:aspartyl-tRNA(Asn)/glutamyl-tRNA(Gln) amidotransferase subunit A|uniref:amidase n=1 Tax=Polaromonas sp. TaxID=1869339 RepID=UPI0037CBB8D2